MFRSIGRHIKRSVDTSITLESIHDLCRLAGVAERRDGGRHATGNGRLPGPRLPKGGDGATHETRHTGGSRHLSIGYISVLQGKVLKRLRTMKNI